MRASGMEESWRELGVESAARGRAFATGLNFCPPFSNNMFSYGILCVLCTYGLWTTCWYTASQEYMQMGSAFYASCLVKLAPTNNVCSCPDTCNMNINADPNSNVQYHLAIACGPEA